MNGELVLYRTHTNRYIFASTVRELQCKLGGGSIAKMYYRTSSGVFHIGYRVGRYWCQAFNITDPSIRRRVARQLMKRRHA